MKRITLITLSVLLLAMTVVGPAFAGADVTRDEFPYYLEFVNEDPCTGNDSKITIAGTATVNEVSKESGIIHTTFKLRGTLTAEDSITGQISSGSVVWNFSEAGGFDGPFTYVYHGHITSPGPGNNVLLVVIVHISPNGVVVVNDALEHVCLDKPPGT